MSRTLPPLNALRAFEAAARLGSFKAAATELHVSQGAISQHVRQLEDWFGQPLFERHNRRVALTPAATAYLAEIGPAFDRIASATSRYGRGARAHAHRAARQQRGHLRAALAGAPAGAFPPAPSAGGRARRHLERAGRRAARSL